MGLYLNTNKIYSIVGCFLHFLLLKEFFCAYDCVPVLLDYFKDGGYNRL